MNYGTIKVDQITFTNAGVDDTLTVSGIMQSMSGSMTVTGTVQGETIIGTSTVSGATVTGNIGQFTVITGGSAGFTTITGNTVTGTTANFVSGVFSAEVSGLTVRGTTVSGATVTGNVGSFATLTGGVITLTSGVFGAGTAALPSISFSGDLNTGIYSPGADQVSISTNGTGRLFVDASGDSLFQGQVFGRRVAGAGRLFVERVEGSYTSPTAVGAANVGALIGRGYDGTQFRETGNITFVSDGTITSSSSPGSVVLATTPSSSTAPTERLRITSDGRLGLGTSTPDALLTVNGVGAHGLGSAAAPSFAFTGDLNTGIYSPGADQLAISTNGTGRLFIDSNGLVGIRKAVPTALCDAVGSVVGFRHTNGSGTSEFYSDSAQTVISSSGSIVASASGANSFVVQTNSSERLRLDSSGRLGLGTSSPNSLLSVINGAVETNRFFYNRISSATAVADRGIRFEIDGTDYGRIYSPNGKSVAIQAGNGTLTDAVTVDQSGRVGIGTTSPGALLSLDNSTASDIRLSVAGTLQGNVYASSSDVNVFAVQANPVRFGTNNTERVRIDSSGRVGIGSTTPAGPLDVVTGAASRLLFRDLGVGARIDSVNLGNSAFEDLVVNGDPLIFQTVGNERARIDSSGRLLVGTSSGIAEQFSGQARIQTAGTNYYGIASFQYSNDNVENVLTIAKSRGTSVGSHVIVQSGDSLGSIRFEGSDGTGFVMGASITGVVDGTPGANDMPGRLVFATTADGASSPTERMRIASGGTVMVNTTSADPVGVSVSQSCAFGPGAADGAFNYYNASAQCLKLGRGNNGDIITFFRNQPSATVVGSVSVTTTATAYNTSSDYRLKENVVPLTGAIDRLNDLQVHRFNFIADPDKTVDGFLAHEAQAVVPECVTGEKDEVDSDGNPVYQGIDQSKLVPLLTAALQEAVAEIESLKARVTALEP